MQAKTGKIRMINQSSSIVAIGAELILILPQDIWRGGGSLDDHAIDLDLGNASHQVIAAALGSGSGRHRSTSATAAAAAATCATGPHFTSLEKAHQFDGVGYEFVTFIRLNIHGLAARDHFILT